MHLAVVSIAMRPFIVLAIFSSLIVLAQGQEFNLPGTICREFAILPNAAAIEAHCLYDGIYRTSRMNLGKCLQNQNGVLSCGTG